MAKRVYKYPLAIADLQNILLPKSAVVLGHPQVQHGVLCLWTLVDPDEKETKRISVVIHGTGHDVPEADDENYRYVGTFQIRAGRLIFHVWLSENKEEEWNHLKSSLHTNGIFWKKSR